MLNQTVIVGRLVSDPELRETDNGNKVTNVTIAVPRSFKNINGEYDTDFVDVAIDGTLAKTTIEYCKKGDIIGVKGSIRSEITNDIRKMILVAERVTFLSSKKADE